MIETVLLKEYLTVSSWDNDQEIEIWNDENDTGIWLDKYEVVKLHQHLTAMLEEIK